MGRKMGLKNEQNPKEAKLIYAKYGKFNVQITNGIKGQGLYSDDKYPSIL
jgi:hypothetical protein